MRILILGIDGYIGWALAHKLLNTTDHQIAGVDDYSRRRRVNEIGSESLLPIGPPSGRRSVLRSSNKVLDIIDCSLGTDAPSYITQFLREIRPDAIFHLAEQPSAPWSMISVSHAASTQIGNVIGTLHLLWAIKEVCPDTHLIKIGTMGEYGTPNCEIPEGMIPDKCLIPSNEWPAEQTCPMANLPFPRSPGSFYHLSKVHDTHNIIFACKTWGLTSTDIMQGIVFGNDYGTRFDYDQYFGTVINRFCTQVIIQHPLTVYGSGMQTRSFLPLADSLQCLTLILNNPPNKGTYRTVNQFANIYSINQIAEIVTKQANWLGYRLPEEYFPNPRAEREDHTYNTNNKTLKQLGYVPLIDFNNEIRSLIKQIAPYEPGIRKEVILPTTTWH